MKFYLSISLFLLASAALQAQIIIEEESTEEVVDVTSMQGKEKSQSKAAMLSLFIPGLGEKYVSNTAKSSFHFFVEGAFLSSFFVCLSYASQYYDNAKAYASIHANAKAGVQGKDEKYYENLADFYDIREYNQIYQLERDTAKFYPENEEWAWQWDSRENYAEYDNILRKNRTMKVVSYFIIGSWAMHRFVSAIDAARMAKNYPIKHKNPVQLYTNEKEIGLAFHF